MAACKSFLAPSCSNCSRNGFCSSFARSSSETTLFSDTGCVLSFLASSSEAAWFLFLIERMRLSLSLHPQLSNIALPASDPVSNVPPIMGIETGRGTHHALGRAEREVPGRFHIFACKFVARRQNP